MVLFTKREIQDNDGASYIYCKYYKFTTTTNASGDYMIFGVPTGSYELTVDADLSNIGLISQYPYDLIREGYNEKLFDSTSKFKDGKNLNNLAQIKNITTSVNVTPFWGDLDQCQVGITRTDLDLNVNIVPTAIFIGSLFGDDEKNSINKNCSPRENMGKMVDMTTTSGAIEMIRKRPDGSIERYDVDGGRVIDDNGTWAYQVPMNLDYYTTDEFGDLVPTDDPNTGLPTRARVRFRISMDSNGGEGRLRERAKYLVPNNPTSHFYDDYTFDETTKDYSFTDLYWNKIYTVANHIRRVQKAPLGTKKYIGIKDVDKSQYNPFPFNNVSDLALIGTPFFQYLCLFITFFSGLVWMLNKMVSQLINIVPIRYMLLKCQNDDYCIGCSPNQGYYDFSQTHPNINDNNNNLWSNCTTANLVNNLNIIDFHFYNDWINGTLYYFMFKHKTKRFGTGKDKFCDYDCGIIGVDNNEDGTPDNNCNNVNIAANCGILQLTQPINTGVIKKNTQDDEFYYAAVAKNGPRLFATKIVNLGSIFDCDWQGVPKFYQYLVDTTYNMPPVAPELYDSDDPDYPNQIEVSGWDSPGQPLNPSNSLIAKISCLGIQIGNQQCQNIKRLCVS